MRSGRLYTAIERLCLVSEAYLLSRAINSGNFEETAGFGASVLLIMFLLPIYVDIDGCSI